MENDLFMVYCPYAARTPFETWIVPREHQASLAEMSDQQKPDFADALKATLTALQQGLNDPPFNYFIHSAPLKGDYSRHYHWHLELIPKLSIAAGFELGTGMWINVVKPEESAAFLRDRMPAGASVGA